jgi:glycolate oxidase
LGAGGAQGLVRVLELLEEELTIDMALLGITDVAHISRSCICACMPVAFGHEMSAFPYIAGGQLR